MAPGGGLGQLSDRCWGRDRPSAGVGGGGGRGGRGEGRGGRGREGGGRGGGGGGGEGEEEVTRTPPKPISWTDQVFPGTAFLGVRSRSAAGPQPPDSRLAPGVTSGGTPCPPKALT